nr:hypothetical protein [Pseudobacteroides cellulosolvens]
MNYMRDGRIILYSLRDPYIKETLDIYNGTIEYLENLKIRSETLNIIKEIYMNSMMENHNNIKGDNYTIHELAGVEHIPFMERKKRILSTSEEDFRRYAGMIKDTILKDTYCVMGNKTTIIDNCKLFDSVYEL